MDITKKIYKLRQNPYLIVQIDEILDILVDMNGRLLTNGEVLKDHNDQLDQNKYMINIIKGQLIQEEEEKEKKAAPQEELKPCPFCGSGVWRDGHEVVHCPVCKIDFNMTPRNWNIRSNA